MFSITMQISQNKWLVWLSIAKKVVKHGTNLISAGSMTQSETLNKCYDCNEEGSCRIWRVLTGYETFNNSNLDVCM